MAKAVGWVKWRRETRETNPSSRNSILKVGFGTLEEELKRRRADLSPAPNAQKSFWSGHCQAHRVPSIFLLLEAQHSAGSFCSTHISWCGARRPSPPMMMLHILSTPSPPLDRWHIAPTIFSYSLWEMFHQNPPRIFRGCFCCPSDSRFVKWGGKKYRKLRFDKNSKNPPPKKRAVVFLITYTSH